MIDFLPDWLEIVVFLLASMISGAIGGFIGISLAAQKEIRRKIARANALAISRTKRDAKI